jgi:hypothetical protein
MLERAKKRRHLTAEDGLNARSPCAVYGAYSCIGTGSSAFLFMLSIIKPPCTIFLFIHSPPTQYILNTYITAKESTKRHIQAYGTLAMPYLRKKSDTSNNCHTEYHDYTQ